MSVHHDEEFIYKFFPTEFDHDPKFTDAESNVMVNGILEHTPNTTLQENNNKNEDFYIIPKNIGEDFAAKMLGIKPKIHVGEIAINQAESLPEESQVQPSLFGNKHNITPAMPNEEPKFSEPERKGFFKRNAKKIGAFVAASVLTLTLIGGNKYTKQIDNEEQSKIKEVPEFTTSTISPTINNTTVSTLPTSSTEIGNPMTQAPTNPPEATVEVNDPSSIVKVIKIQPGKDSWVWNIVQKELTGSYGGSNNSDIRIVRATLDILNSLAVDNGFENDTSKLSQLDTGFILNISVATQSKIEQYKTVL
jgi:hypothetical protein